MFGLTDICHCIALVYLSCCVLIPFAFVFTRSLRFSKAVNSETGWIKLGHGDLSNVEHFVSVYCLPVGREAEGRITQRRKHASIA